MAAVDINGQLTAAGQWWAAKGRDVHGVTHQLTAQVSTAVSSDQSMTGADGIIAGPVSGPANLSAPVADIVFPAAGDTGSFTFQTTKDDSAGVNLTAGDNGVHVAVMLGGVPAFSFGAFGNTGGEILEDSFIPYDEYSGQHSISFVVPENYVPNNIDNGLYMVMAHSGSYGYIKTGLTNMELDLVAPVPDPDPDPGPDPDPDPEDPTHAAMVLRVLRKLDRADDVDLIDACAEHVELVTEYVRGYTRGRGFDPLTDEPARGLQAVIVGAAAKLTSNPDQLTSYTAGDYSERGALLIGWTLPELAVLNNFRRRQS